MAEHTPSLVSTQWLADHLDDADIVVLDASRHLLAAKRDPLAEFEAGHIPGARFLDLAQLTDTSSCVPAALPTPDQVAQALAGLGVAHNARIVLYDDSTIRTSARAWFALTCAGEDNVSILDGGLAKWRAEGRALHDAPIAPQAHAPKALTPKPRVRSKADMLANLESKAEQMLDARPAERVFGDGQDPVHGGQNGRIPGSLNLPFSQVFAQDGTYKSPEQLREAFENAGIDLSAPIITTCGSGVTASVLLFALHLIGHKEVALYDGSWMEWGSDPDTPKEQGPAKA